MGTSLVVQWFRICASTPGGMHWILGWGTKIPHSMGYGQKKKKRRRKKLSGLQQVIQLLSDSRKIGAQVCLAQALEL